MKAMTQLEVIKSIRKPFVGQTRVVRAAKGGGYRRPQGKRWSNDD